MQAIWHFKGGLTKGVANLAFSPSGNRLAGVALDNDHYVAVYDVEIGQTLCMVKGDTAVIVELAFKNENVTIKIFH